MGEQNAESALFATVDDTVWPINLAETAWWIRYGPDHHYHAAAAIEAYMALVDPTIPQYVAIEKLKRARRAQIDGYEAQSDG